VPNTLILLVGSNPLPNYLAACALRPARLFLAYTPGTASAKDRLEAALRPVLGTDVFQTDAGLLIDDATCATTVRRAIDLVFRKTDNPGEILLNYTGGTKVMAAHARMVFEKSGGRPEHASYLDEGDAKQPPRLRPDDGPPMAIDVGSNVPLDLRTILALHGINHTPRQPWAPAPTLEDAKEILCKVLGDVPLAAALYCERERLEDKEYSNPGKAVAAQFRADRFGLRLSLESFPTDGHLEGLPSSDARKSWFKQWYKFIGGEWLEVWLGTLIGNLRLTPKPDVTVGVDAFRGARRAQLEVDIAVLRGHRSYLISCTTDTTKTLCKSKLFEVAVRSRHLGGDLARAALVCLADDRTVSLLQADIDDLWGASNTTKVFGVSDLHNWSDCDGQRPNLDSLTNWLES